MPEALDPTAVDAALNATARPADVVQVPASELVKLREAAGNYAQLESTTAGFVVNTTIDSLLALRTDLVPGVAAKIAREIGGDFAARMVDGRWVVQTKDGKAPSDHLANFLADPSNAIYVKSGNRGGSGADGTQSTASGPDPFGAGDGLTPVQRIAANMAASKAAFGGRGIGVPTRS